MSILGYIKDILNNPAKYRKFLVAFGSFIAISGSAFYPDAQWLQPLLALLAAGGVVTIPNKTIKDL